MAIGINPAYRPSPTFLEQEAEPPSIGRFGLLHCPRPDAGGRLSKKQIARIVHDAARRLGLEKVHPHLLRHTMASLLRKRGVDLDVIRDRLGHESIATTERYIHGVPRGQAEAAKKLEDL